MATIDRKTLDEMNSLSADNVSYKRRFEKIISEPIISELSDLSFEACCNRMVTDSYNHFKVH